MKFANFNQVVKLVTETMPFGGILTIVEKDDGFEFSQLNSLVSDKVASHIVVVLKESGNIFSNRHVFDGNPHKWLLSSNGETALYTLNDDAVYAEIRTLLGLASDVHAHSMELYVRTMQSIIVGNCDDEVAVERFHDGEITLLELMMTSQK